MLVRAARPDRPTQIYRQPFLKRRKTENKERSTMSFVLGLQCRECGQEYEKNLCMSARNALARWRIHYD